jgi:hypothetical protein
MTNSHLTRAIGARSVRAVMGDEAYEQARTRWSDQEWFDWLCGLALPAVVYGPPLAIALLPARYALRWQWHGADFGALLAFLPGVALVALIAPLVLYRRRDALLAPFRPWSVFLVWKFGARLSVLARYGQARQLKITAAAVPPDSASIPTR